MAPILLPRRGRGKEEKKKTDDDSLPSQCNWAANSLNPQHFFRGHTRSRVQWAYAQDFSWPPPPTLPGTEHPGSAVFFWQVRSGVKRSREQWRVVLWKKRGGRAGGGGGGSGRGLIGKRTVGVRGEKKKFLPEKKENDSGEKRRGSERRKRAPLETNFDPAESFSSFSPLFSPYSPPLIAQFPFAFSLSLF